MPPLLLIAGFKLYMSRTAEYGFRYFTPSPAEEAEFVSRQEKRTHHKEMETRFLHPALQRSQLFTIMVHKSQEALAREVLSEYPWFRDSEVEIKAIREVCLHSRLTRLTMTGKPGVRSQGRFRPGRNSKHCFYRYACFQHDDHTSSSFLLC